MVICLTLEAGAPDVGVFVVVSRHYVRFELLEFPQFMLVHNVVGTREDLRLDKIVARPQIAL